MSVQSDASVQNSTRITGVFKDYLLGLDCMRNDVTKKEETLANILTAFYKVSGNELIDNQYQDYLRSISGCLDTFNGLMVANGAVRPITVDGQIPIARLINLLKSSSLNLDAATLETIIDFWENNNYSLELCQILLDSLEKDVYRKLTVLSTYNSMVQEANEVDKSNNDQVKLFVTDIERFAKFLPEKIMKCRLLIQSCGTHLRLSLLDSSTVSDQILVGVAVTRYPLLRLMPDLEFKFNEMFRMCKKWLDREETFMLNINQQIRERRLLAKEKEIRMVSARDHRRSVLKSLKTSFILCQNSKIKMKSIMNELRTLETQIRAATSEYHVLGEEKYKTQSMAEFLSLSITQTRKNYSLQMKKQRLELQVAELETTLLQLDAEISMLKQEMIFKSHEKTKTQDSLQVVEKTYLNAKSELELYSQSLTNYKTDLLSIKQSLSAIEGLKLLKTSPEYIENVFGSAEKSHKQLVHLAPSLLNSINAKTLKQKQ